MGFLDNVKDALKDAVSSQASKDQAAKRDDVVVDRADTTKADDPATPAPPTIPVDAEPTPEPTIEPTPEPTVGPVQPADSVPPPPAPATPTETAEDETERQERKEDRQERKEDRQEAREDAREKREDAREAKFETYTVKAGDSLSEVGARFGVPYLEIAKLNNIENPDLIFPGQVFRIPKN